MPYRRAQNLDKSLIFAEYFNDEQSVRRNGGVPIGATFTKGKASITNLLSSNRISWDFQKGSLVYSVRIRFKLNTLSDGYRYAYSLLNGDNSTRRFQLRIDQTTDYINCAYGGGTYYLDSVSYPANTTVAEAGVWYEVIAITTSTDLYRFAINIDQNNNSNSSDISYDLIEIYNKALTAEEVSNLYSNSRYVMPQLDTADHQRILHVTARNGVVQNLVDYHNGVATPEPVLTDIEVVKDGFVRSPLFNGSTSKIDLGGYNDLTGDITVMAWIKYVEDDDEILAYRNAILANGQFGFGQRDNDALTLSRNGFSNSSVSNYNILEKYEWNFVCAVSKADGTTLLYANGEDVTNSDNAGTPVAGSNIIIGEYYIETCFIGKKNIIRAGMLVCSEIYKNIFHINYPLT